jgi:alpha-glucosidase
MIRVPAAYPVDLELCTARIVRLRLGERCSDASSYLASREWPNAPQQTQRDTSTVIDTGELTISLPPDGVTFGDRDGVVRLQVSLDQTQVRPLVLLRMQIFGEQHFYGLGEGGPQFDRLGAVRRMWNFQVNRGQGADIAIPLLVSNAGYGVFFDSSAAALLQPGDAADGAWIEYHCEGKTLDLYFIGCSDLRQVLDDAAALLGRATMPPRWALGYMQSSRHFTDTAEARAMAHQFRAKRLPCDALIFLSSYGTAKGWNRGVGHLEFEPELFEHADTILADFRDQNFRIITHEYPVLHEASPLFGEAESNAYLLDVAYPHLKPTYPGAVVYKEGQRLIDFAKEGARTWWWRAHQHLRDLGVAGWWLDGGEGPPRQSPASFVHNRYDLLRQQAFADGEANDRSNIRPFLLCRSGGPGMQRFGAIPWSGDINATFASLELQIRTGLNVGMSGVPHWGTDTGGFYRVGANDAELFVRWFQFSAFCSVFRGHGFVWREHLPWSHGERVEKICREYLELRSRLMPYTYTLAWQASSHGLPTMRPLVLNYPDDPAVWDLGTEYLWGDDILVAPVTHKGATQWPVYLPAGAWHDFWTQETFQGRSGITVSAPLERLPLFVRAGAIIPMGPVLQYDGELPIDEVTLLVYPDQESSFTLYEDDGLTNAYRDGGFATTRITCAATAASVMFGIAAPAGDTALLPANRRYTLKLATSRAPHDVTMDGSQLTWHHDGHFLLVEQLHAPCSVLIMW